MRWDSDFVFVCVYSVLFVVVFFLMVCGIFGISGISGISICIQYLLVRRKET